MKVSRGYKYVNKHNNKHIDKQVRQISNIPFKHTLPKHPPDPKKKNGINLGGKNNK